MSRCEHRYLDEPSGASCTREEHPQNPGGHVYAAGDGSDLNDRHGDQGHG